MKTFPCPYLGVEVELSEERESHIAETHPDLLPEHVDQIGDTLRDPDQVRRSRRFTNARLFSKWYDDLIPGKHLVVVVVSEAVPRAEIGSSLPMSPDAFQKETWNGSEVNI